MIKTKQMVRKIKELEKEEIIRFSLIFCFSFFIVFLSKDSKPFLLILPIISLSFYLGNYEEIVSMIGIFISSMLISFELFIVSCLMITAFFIILLITKLFKIDMKIRLAISSFVTDFLFRLLYLNNSVLEGLLTSLVIALFTFLVMKYMSFLIVNRKKYDSFFVIIVSFILSMYAAILSFNLIIHQLLLYIIMLFLAFIGGKSEGVLASFLAAFIYFFFQNKIDINVLYYCSTLFISLIITTKKYNFVICILLLNGLYCLFINEPMNYLYSLILAIFLFVCFPSKLFFRIKKSLLSNAEILKEQEEKYQKIHHSLERKLTNLKKNYDSVKEEFLINKNDNLLDNRLELLFKDVCICCPKNKECHLNKENKIEEYSRLYFVQNFNGDEQAYIDKNCLKSSYFLRLLYEHRLQYEIEKKWDKDYKCLQNNFLDNLVGISEVIDSLKGFFIKQINDFQLRAEEKIKRELDKCGYEVIYINLSCDEFGNKKVDLGIRECGVEDIKDKVKELIENIIESPLLISKIKEVNYEDYYRVVYEKDNRYLLSYGVTSLSKDPLNCGDSSVVFSYGNEKYFVISDGMGCGIKAKEESKMTINSFKQIVETGVSSSTAIKTINSLLKMKNKKEMFATLDILKIHDSSFNATLTKTCAPSTYYFSENRMYVIDSSSLPIGIVDDVDTYDEVLKIKKKDIILMASDGFDLEREKIECILKEHKDKNAQQIVDIFISLYDKDSLMDDITLLLIKVI